MRLRHIAAWIILAFTVADAQTIEYSKFFADNRLRVDYYHTGTKTEEMFSLEQVYEEPSFAGSRTNLVDTLNLGLYQVRVYDAATNQLIYTHGFASIFGEWKTTDEAALKIRRTFSESVLIPCPKRPIQLAIAVRDHWNRFVEKWSTYVDPSSRFVSRTPHGKNIPVTMWLKNGDPATHVDLVVLAEGYTEKEMEKFRKDADRLLKALFSTSPFKEMKSNFNVTLVETPSQESGINRPRENVWVNTALETTFNFFDLPRYVLTAENRRLRDDLARIPYDAVIILLNTPYYGGGGIYNLYSIACADNQWSSYVFVHEFGHCFGGLGDEYYASTTPYNGAYPAGIEPWEPNITALLSPPDVKWRDLVAPGTPVPTPADSSKYPFPTVGAFEGAGYAAKGLYRPAIDCIMISRTQTQFDPVCARALRNVIEDLSR